MKRTTEDKMKLVKVQDTSVLRIKQPDKIFAIDNRCPHLACGFSGGSLDNFWIICPCHD
jgi:nitrite reductase/ring-hydroxylating ferredoxin subunit